MAGDIHATGLLIGFFWRKSLLQRGKMRWCFTKHSGYLLLHKDTELPITWQPCMESYRCHYAFPKNKCLNDYSQHCELSTQPFMHENEWGNDIINKHQKETQNLTKKLQIISHPSTLQSARTIPTHNVNPWTTVQPVHSILTTTYLQLGSYLYISY